MLDEKKVKGIELLIENELTDIEISKEIGISARQFARWKKEPEFITTWQQKATYLKNSIAKDIERKLSKHTDTAITTLIDLMITCDNSETKRKIAESILDRVGGKVSSSELTIIKDEGNAGIDLESYFDSIKDEIGEDINE